MKISLTTNNKIYTIEDELGFDAVGIDEAVEMFKGLLVSAGFHPQTVDEYFEHESKWWPKNDEPWFDSPEDKEALERLARDRRVQEYQDNLYRQDDLTEDSRAAEYSKQIEEDIFNK